MLDCFNGVIGLSNNASTCNELGRPLDYNDSTSGIYLDDLPSLNSLDKYFCESNAWDILVKGRESGIRYFKSKLSERLLKKFQLNRIEDDSLIGKNTSIKNVIPTKNYSYVRIECAPLKNGMIYIDSINTQYSTTGTVVYELHSNIDGLLKTITLNTTAIKYTVNESSPDFPIELPMYSKGRKVTYYLVHQFTANVPREVSVSCGCSGDSPYFNSKRPTYEKTTRVNGDSWMNYVMVGGGEINSISELDTLGDTSDNYTYGISIGFRAVCSLSNSVCNDKMDYSNGIGMTLAEGLQKAQGIKIAELLLNRSGISGSNLIDHKAISANMVNWMLDLDESLDSIVKQINPNDTNCLKCDTKSNARKALML